MKTILYTLIFLLCLGLFTGCNNEDEPIVHHSSDEKQPATDESITNIPDGYFIVTFQPEGSPDTRAAVSDSDGRVRHLRYIIYKSTGEFVKEKVILKTTDPTPTWPLTAIKDTLPKGAYKAVFLGNVEKTLFPVPASGGTTTYSDVLVNYKTTYSGARILLPNSEFTDTSEYYWANNVTFSDSSPNPTVLLQRIISMLNLHRNFVDTQQALNQLVSNIVTQINYKNLIQTSVQGLLPGLLKNALLGSILVGLDGIVNQLTTSLVAPVTNALYAILLKELANQIGMSLTGNATQAGALAGLGVLLNPWATNEASTAIVTIRNFPKAIGFNQTITDTNNNIIRDSLHVTDYYTGDQRFKFAFTGGTVYDEKDILIKGFNGIFNVRKINVIKQGLVSGLLVDQVIDSSLLLNGAFIDINDPIQATVATNRRYKANYSFVDLKLKSYAQQSDGNHSLTLTVKLGDIANIDGYISGILGAVLMPLVKNITISVPVNLPLLGVDNLELSGSWSAVTAY